MPDQHIKQVKLLSGVISLSATVLVLTPSVYANQKPSLLFQQQSIPLSTIFEEWKAKGLNANTYLCVCDRDICDTRPGWPFRRFNTGEAIPVLGEFNRNEANRQGFICARRRN